MKYTRRTKERKANQTAKMGGFSEREQSQKNGFRPNGLVVEEATSITRPLDPRRWDKAEERIAELISCIQPNQKSEKHRNDVASYVKRLISRCIPCQVFTYGSVPLKTYLPDGDIDLTVFSEDHNLKDNWAKEVQRMLQIEEKNERAEFPVQEVQLIQAEVKIIKCLVDNIVVDISFNQLGGLCTLCFLEEVDNLISKNHLFKRSIILVKAWCYYESRILGAHHALISTYGLETLILYIFHIFNNSFAGPLEVLYRFLEFFSKFDWAKFCVSLWGPVPISSLPNMAATPPRKDGGDLLLSKDFLDSCGTAYSVIPAVPENREIPFTSKHLNVIDPLRLNNNLGRSVSKGNFYRIRSAFSFGAQELGKILECPLEDIVPKLNQFFFNTLDRHGKGFRPDAPVLDVDESHNCFGPSLQPKNLPPTARTMYSNKDLSSLKEKDNNEAKNHMPSRVDHFYTERSKLWKKQHDDIKRTLLNTLQTNGHVMHNFARTSSSPELTSMSNEAASRNSRRMIDSGIREINVTKQFTDEPSLRESSSRCSLASEADHSSGNCVGKLVSSSTSVVISSAHEPIHRCGEEQNFVYKSFTGNQHYGGHPQMPVNLASHSFVPYPPSVLRYSHQAYGASIPTNMSAVELDWGNSGPFSAPFHQQFRPVREIDDHDMMITGLNERLGSMKVNHPGHVDEHSGFGGDCYDHSTRDIDEHDIMIRGLNERLGSLKVNHVDEHSGFGSDHYDNSNRDIDPENGGLPSSSSSSSITKAASENSWDGKPDNLADPSRYPVERRTSSIRKSGPTANGGWEEYGEQVDHSCNDDLEDCAHLSSTESITHSVTALPLEVNRIPGFGQPQMSYQNSMSPFGPLFVNPGSHQGIAHNHPVFPVAFYPGSPHVPFVTMVPIYNVPAETRSPGEPMNNSDCSLNHTGAPMSASGEYSLGRGSDIFNSDFINHWNNLQYGRHCQGSQLRHPIGYSPSPYPPPILVPPPPPPSEGSPSVASPGRSNSYTHAVPNSAPQRGSVKPAGVSRREQVSKQRNGTGTYFPNPNMIKERQWSAPRHYRGDYDHDRIDNHEDREANWNNWNLNSKPRHNGRGQPRKYYEKQSTKIDRVPGGY